MNSPTDRELLEGAAKAAGYEHLVWTQGASPIVPRSFRAPGDKVYWNPLTDDGDALRLEVALKMTAAWEPMRDGWSLGAIVNSEFKWLSFDEDRKRSATRAAYAIAGEAAS